MENLFYLPLVMFAYLIFAYIKYGMTRSISKSYTLLTKIEQLFPIVVLILSVVVPAIVLGTNANPDSPWNFLWWLAGMLILVVGIFPTSETKLQSLFHNIGAMGGIITGMLAAALTLDGWLSIVLPSAFAVFVGVQEIKKLNIKLKNNTYWTEVIAIIVIIGLLLKQYYS